jgi:hypothetical protein
MKTNKYGRISRLIGAFAVTAAIILGGCHSGKKQPAESTEITADTIALFNGHNLDNWVIVLKDSLAPPDSTFYVKDGLLCSTGQPFGYVRTKEKYSDFDLLVEWRWPAEEGNSGVFLFVNKDKVFPECLECQLYHGSAGDFIAVGETDFKEHTDKANMVVAKRAESSEKPAGEWNLYDIRQQGDSVSVYVNGVLQNIASGLNRTSGWIALQSEGAPIEFRSVRLIRKD